MIEPISERQKTLIVKNVINAVKDITKLNQTGYKFLYLCNGFIAHYNIHGFKEHYENHSLFSDIMNNSRMNQWYNFHKGEKNYDYYMSRKDVYNRIMEELSRSRKWAA